MKLSKAQQAVVDGLKYVIDEARSYDTPEAYFDATNNNNALYNTAEKMKAKDPEGWEWEVKWFERKRSGIYLVQAKTETVKKLEALGIIEVIKPAKWKGDYELVKLLNY